MTNVSNEEEQYDFIVVGAGAAGSVIAAELSASGAQVVFKYKGKMPDRPADSNAVEAEAYLSSGSSGDTDISLVLHQLPVVTPEVASRFGTPPADTFTIAPALVQPTSIGSVRLASHNFQNAAVIDGNYLGTDHDFAAIVRAIEAAREIGNQHAFDSLRESELIPGPKASAEEIREFVRLASASFGHAVGTCKMGVDKLAVVDPQLRVHGIVGLRVADASVMPQIITGAGDKRVDPHDCGPRRQADSRLTKKLPAVGVSCGDLQQLAEPGGTSNALSVQLK
jgi:choline dehydrogenase-like flavoprotein